MNCPAANRARIALHARITGFSSLANHKKYEPPMNIVEAAIRATLTVTPTE